MAALNITKKLKLKKPASKTVAISTLAGLLAACNSDNDSSAVVAPVVTNLTGAVVKGPLSGALVYADADGDGVGDGAPITTASDGSYTVSTTNANATIIAMSGPNTVDTSSGEALTGVTLKAPAGSTVVTPATTILEAQPEIEPAQLAIALGIPTTAADGSAIDIMSFNPYAADADPAAALAAEKAAQQVMVTIKAVSAAAEGAGMAVEDAFEQAMASVAEVVSAEAEKIDVSSTAAIAAAEATMATTKVDFSDSTVLAAVSTAVQTKVVAAAAADTTIVVDTDAFAAVLDTAVTAVSNVNAAIEAITDTDLTSTESMGTFATLTDVATEIKAAAEAEVVAPGSGADLVTFTDAAAVTTAVAEAVLEVEAYVGGGDSGETSGGGGGGAVVVVDPAAVAAAQAAAEAAEAAQAAAIAATRFTISDRSGASWDSASASPQSLDITYTGSTKVLDVTSDVQVAASDFTAAFDEVGSNINTQEGNMGFLSISNLTPPTSGSGNDQEITITIENKTNPDGVTNSGKIVVSFKMDWSVSGSDVTFTSDDTSLDVVYTEFDNSSTTITMPNTVADVFTITNDGLYSGNTTLNWHALKVITGLENTGHYTFDNLESRFAVAGTTLDVTVDTSNLDLYFGSVGQVNSITSTIDIV